MVGSIESVEVERWEVLGRRYGAGSRPGNKESSEGRNNNDNDHGYKFSCTRIKLSTRSLVGVSVFLRENINPILATTLHPALTLVTASH